MIAFIQAGGMPSIVILIFSALALVAAVQFARRPDAKGRATIRSLIAVVITSIVLGTLMCFHSVLGFIETHPEEPSMQILLTGARESLSPAILGLALLSVVYMIVAVGERRLAR